MSTGAPNGQFCWYELMTTDLAGAASFYGEVVGWSAIADEVPGMSYTILAMGQDRVGGIMTIPEEAARAGAPPCWLGYVHVDDVDATAARITAAGGALKRPAVDIPGIGRFAVVNDPQGAVFIVFRSEGGTAPPPRSPTAPGHAGWHELHAGDRDTAFGFYAELFGWIKTSTFDMGPVGIYQLFATSELPVGGVMTKMAEAPQPFWIFYFTVPAIDAAAARITAAGGTILHGPMEVPGGSWILQGRDPQGAMFALTAPMR